MQPTIACRIKNSISLCGPQISVSEEVKLNGDPQCLAGLSGPSARVHSHIISLGLSHVCDTATLDTSPRQASTVACLQIPLTQMSTSRQWLLQTIHKAALETCSHSASFKPNGGNYPLLLSFATHYFLLTTTNQQGCMTQSPSHKSESAVPFTSYTCMFTLYTYDNNNNKYFL